MTNQRGSWVCWMSTSRNNGLVWRTHTERLLTTVLIVGTYQINLVLQWALAVTSIWHPGSKVLFWVLSPATSTCLKWRFLVFLGSNSTAFSASCFLFIIILCTARTTSRVSSDSFAIFWQQVGCEMWPSLCRNAVSILFVNPVFLMVSPLELVFLWFWFDTAS